jgi:MraZ protein
MFRGHSYHTIDTKGRVIIPTRFKELIKNGDKPGVMVSMMDGGLVAFPFEHWEKIENKILSAVEKNDALRRFRRWFIGGAHECTCDKNDRILIPPTLRDYAGLEKDIVLAGVLDHFEIWSRKNWEIENAEFEKDRQEEDVRKVIAGLGI